MKNRHHFQGGWHFNRPTLFSFSFFRVVYIIKGMLFHSMDVLPALIYLFLLVYLLTQEAAGITVAVYYAAVQERKRGCTFSSSLLFKLQLHLLMTF